jgi:TPR repeat protein
MKKTIVLPVILVTALSLSVHCAFTQPSNTPTDQWADEMVKRALGQSQTDTNTSLKTNNTVPPAGFAETTFFDDKLKAEQGDAAAQFRIGVVYLIGVDIVGLGDDATTVDPSYFKLNQIKFDPRTARIIDKQNFGMYYAGSKGVKKDHVEAAIWFRKAAEQDHIEAQCLLGACYYYGEGVAVDYDEAVKWFVMAADHGNAAARCFLGDCYQDGTGVAKDISEAYKCYRLAADQGDAVAQRCLGFSYYNGACIEQNYDKAFKWLRKAADQGDGFAQYDLGGCYLNGNGVEKDQVEAYKWYWLAAKQGVSFADSKRDDLAAKMAPGQIAEAEQLCHEFHPHEESAPGKFK